VRFSIPSSTICCNFFIKKILTSLFSSTVFLCNVIKKNISQVFLNVMLAGFLLVCCYSVYNYFFLTNLEVNLVSWGLYFLRVVLVFPLSVFFFLIFFILVFCENILSFFGFFFTTGCLGLLKKTFTLGFSSTAISINSPLYVIFQNYENIFTFIFNKFLNLNLESLSLFQNYILSNYLSYPVFVYFGLFFFLTTISSLLCSSYLGLYGVFIINLISLTFLWLSFLPYVFHIFSNNLYYYVSFGKWMYLTTNYKVSFDFLFDVVSISFSFLTLTIAQFVYVYTFSYFRYEPLVDRLVLFLNLFIISMVFLVSSGNLINLFLGWEMIGLTSFFLINFWSARVGTLKAAFKAYSFNKTSDLFLFVVIVLIFNTTFTLDIPTIITQVHLYENYTLMIFVWEVNYLEVISLLFLICAFIKSAQFGAHI